MMYVLIVVVIIGVIAYACLKKKKRGNTEKPHEEEKPHDVDNHTGITVKVPIESKGVHSERRDKERGDDEVYATRITSI